MFSFALLIVAEWVLFALSWILPASWSSTVDKRPGLQREVLYRERVPMLAPFPRGRR